MKTFNVGIVGLSEGNGHPFSFSAIVNGYSEEGLSRSGWGVIYDYVRVRDSSEFGIEGITITHAWTQNEDETQKLCAACKIPYAAKSINAMMEEVDAIIIARDDFESHLSTALPILKAGLPVFVDKPLCLEQRELQLFRPFLFSGQLMSCSGMYFAKELDIVRQNILEYGSIRLIRGAIVLSWEKYGVHLLDALFRFVPGRPRSIVALGSGNSSFAISMDDGSLLQLDALGSVPRTFRIDIWGEKLASSHEILDNFSMFRRMLWHFARMIQTGQSQLPPEHTIKVVRTLIAGTLARSQKREVALDEVIV